MHESYFVSKKLTCYVSGVLLAYAGLMRELIAFLNLQVSLNEKSHLLDGCDISIKIDITNVFF